MFHLQVIYIEKQALQERYMDTVVRINNRKKLQHLKMFSFYIIPAILAAFTTIYFVAGIIHAESFE